MCGLVCLGLSCVRVRLYVSVLADIPATLQIYSVSDAMILTVHTTLLCCGVD